MTPDEPALAAAIAAAVEASRVRRVPLSAILSAAASVDRTAASAVGWRARVARALGDLAADGRITLPATRFDRSAEPPLPSYVTRPTPERGGTAQMGRVVWHAELAWAAEADDRGELLLGDRRFLVAVNAWLRRRRGVVVPLRERSLDVFGDEKLLEAWVLGPLFGSGRLTLELLECEPCWPPVEQLVLGTGPWLVVENYTTYVSISRRATDTGFGGRIVWGSGNQVNTRLATLAAAGERCPDLYYFGDIDAGGFRVARSAMTRAAELGLGDLVAASGLYRLALEHGTPRRAGPPTNETGMEWLRTWLGAELGPAAAKVVAAGERIVQECVGTELLAGRSIEVLLEDALGR